MTSDRTAPPADLLATIVAATRRIVEVRQAREPIDTLRAKGEIASAGRKTRRFEASVGQPDRLNVIAECKRRSPSRGVLRADYDAVSIARGYAARGAAAISILTEPTFFDGSLEHLQAVRHVVDVPFVLGTLDAPDAQDLVPAVSPVGSLSERMQDAWIAFARTGSPQTPDLPAWARYAAPGRTTMLLGPACGSVDAPNDAERQFWATRAGAGAALVTPRRSPAGAPAAG